MRFGKGVKLVAEFAVVGVVFDEEFFHARKKLVVRRERGRGIDFHAVAGGKDDAFSDEAGVAQRLKCAGNFLAGKGEAFAQLDGRGAVAQANDDDAHAGKVTGDEGRVTGKGANAWPCATCHLSLATRHIVFINYAGRNSSW